MFSHDGKVFKIMDLVGKYCLLNMLWIVCSIPIITIFSSTAAMLGVIREWSNGNEPPIIKSFFLYGKKYFKKSSLVGILQMVILIILVSDFLVIWNLEGNFKFLLAPIFILFGLAFLFMSLYIYPLLVEYDLSMKQLLRNSFYLTISRPASPTVITIFCCVIVFFCTFLRFLPVLCAFSITSFVTYYIVKRTIKRIEKVAVLPLKKM